MKIRPILLLSLAVVRAGAQAPGGVATPAAIQVIREQDLRADLFAMAGDALRGREAGTLDEMRASMWTAEQLRKIGLAPMGEDGTYFQWFNMRRTRVSTIGSSVRIGGKPFAIWTDITPASNTVGDVVGTTVFVGDGSDTTIDVRGRVAVVTLRPTSQGTRTTVNTPEYRAVRQGITVQSGALTRRGAAAVIIVADSMGEMYFDAVAKLQSRGTYTVIGGANRFAPAGRGAGGSGEAGGGGALAQPQPAPVLFAHQRALAQLREDGQGVEIHLRSEQFDAPSVNIIGVVRGTDPVLRNEYVLFSSHQDHDGVRYAVARRFHLERRRRQRHDQRRAARDRARLGEAAVEALGALHLPRRRGARAARLAAGTRRIRSCRSTAIGGGAQRRHDRPQSSRHGVAARDHSRRTGTRPRWCRWRSTRTTRDGQVRARFVVGSPDASRRLVLPQRPRAVRAAERAGALLQHATCTTTTTRRATSRDRIDYAKLTRMTKWMYLTGWIVANAKERPAIDAGFQLER